MSAKRLESTKAIFNGHLQTTFNLFQVLERQVTKQQMDLLKIQTRLNRASRRPTLERIRLDLKLYADEMNYSIPAKNNKTYLINKVRTYRRQNTLLLYAGTHQTITSMCVIYEDLIKRLVLKYYEENIMRIPKDKQSLKNHVLIGAIKRGDNMHHTLAEHVTSDQMGGSVEDWHEVLKKQKMSSLTTSSSIKELFLIRNCFVHNNRRVSSKLHEFLPEKYRFRDSIRITPSDVKFFKDELHKSATYIMSEYNRIHPQSLGTWL